MAAPPVERDHTAEPNEQPPRSRTEMMNTVQHPTGTRARMRAVFQKRQHPHSHSHGHGVGRPTGILGPDDEKHSAGLPTHNGTTNGRNGSVYNHNGHKVQKGIKPEGESGRRGFHPLMFPLIMFRSSSRVSMMTNICWFFTIAAFPLYYCTTNNRAIFAVAYLGMIAPANALGFSGQELARKLPTVFGVFLETLLGSLVELILFMVLISRPEEENIEIIKAAILGSILANCLLCCGFCFLVSGIWHPELEFHAAISEVGANLLFVAGVAIAIPTIFYSSLSSSHDPAVIAHQSLNISHATAIVLLCAFVAYAWFQMRSKHSLFADIYSADEMRDRDRSTDMTKEKLTFTEAIVAVVLSITFVAFMAIFLVSEIRYIRSDDGLSDSFIGLILIPLVEKFAEHLTAIDEAFDSQMNLALSHVLGASIQTALLNTPLVVLVGWGLHKENMSLNFEIFDLIMLILAILVVSSFLRDRSTDWLEGALCIMVYILIAISAFFYPNPPNAEEPASSGSEIQERAVQLVAEALLRRG